MKEGSKGAFRIFAALALVAAFLVAGTRPALAETSPYDHRISELKGSVTIYLSSKFLGPGPMTGAYERYIYTGSVTGVSSSNTSVLEAKTYTDMYNGGETALVLNATKPGKATVTYTRAGKRRSAKIVVKRYTNPVKQFSIGGKNYKSTFNKSQYSWFDKKFLGKAVKVKAAKGWKVKALYVHTLNPNTRKSSAKRIKNGARVPKSNAYDVSAVMQNKKTKGTIHLSFGTQ